MDRGDDNLLRAAIGLLEERGHNVVGVADLAPELLSPSGVLGARSPTETDRVSIATGLGLLRALSPFDIGQAALVRGERILAVEGPEGTDRMLARVRGGFGLAMFGRARLGGVLVKVAKTGQDRRVDLPAIGPRTVLYAARSGLAGIAVGAGETLILERERTIAVADRLGLFVVGVDANAETFPP